jgi:hypothetical protein
MVILNNLHASLIRTAYVQFNRKIPLQITSWGEKNLLYTGKRLIQRNFKPASSRDPAALQVTG